MTCARCSNTSGLNSLLPAEVGFSAEVVAMARAATASVAATSTRGPVVVSITMECDAVSGHGHR